MSEKIEFTHQERNELEDHFRNFWYKLSGISKGNVKGEEADSIKSEFVEYNEEDKKYHVRVYINNEESDDDYEGLWLRGLPKGPKDPSRNLYVRIQFEEIIRKIGEENPEYEIVESNVRIQYIKVEGFSGTVVQGLHFDFKEYPQKNHPIFHSQIQMNSISSSARNESFELEIPDSDIERPQKFPRIPSAPVDLLGAIFMIMHDNNHDNCTELLEEENGWPSNVHNLMEKLPKFPKNCFEPHPQGGNPMITDWWYLHSTSDGEGNPQRSIVRQ